MPCFHIFDLVLLVVCAREVWTIAREQAGVSIVGSFGSEGQNEEEGGRRVMMIVDWRSYDLDRPLDIVSLVLLILWYNIPGLFNREMFNIILSSNDLRIQVSS